MVAALLGLQSVRGGKDLTDHPAEAPADCIVQAKSGPPPADVNKVLLAHH